MTSLTPDASTSLNPKGDQRYRPAMQPRRIQLELEHGRLSKPCSRGIVLRTTFGFYTTRRGERPRSLLVR
jgi:hypothetical protein